MVSSQTIPHLTSGRLLARNTVWNLIGQVVPVGVGVLAVPPLLRGLGVPRFGVLSLAWIVIGYFSLFDLGIGRAVTKLVAEKLGTNQEHEIPPLVWTSLFLMLVMGGVGGVVLAGMSPWLVHVALKVPRDLRMETLTSFYLMSATIPAITVTSGLRGILEAQQRFYLLNAIRVPTSLFSFLGPLLVLPFSHRLVPVIAVLILGRLAGGAAHLIACLHSMPGLRRTVTLQSAVIQPLFRFGGWMTVSNVIGPIMVYVDRFLIGGLLSVAAVAYYSAPLDLVLRLTFIPQAVSGVLFPAFAVSLVQSAERTGPLFSRGVKYIFLAMLPLTFITIALAPEGLRLWLGEGFAQNSSLVLRWLAGGVLINAVAYVPFALIQSAGRPHVTAAIHLLELPLYLAGVWVLTKHFGIAGAAMAWTARVALDAVCLFYFAHQLLPRRPKLQSSLIMTMAAALAVCYASTLVRDLAMRVAFAILALLATAVATWFWGMSPSERSLVRQFRGRKSLGVS